MNTLMMFCAAVGVTVLALGLHQLQARLEQWDYNRHAED